MLCGKCLLEIEEDSTYCDQCGSAVMICPECGYLGTSNQCPNDGTRLILNNDKKNYQNKNFFKTERVREGKRTNVSPVLTLSNLTLSLNLEIKNNDILGRAVGRFTQELYELKQISSKHVSFIFDNDTWMITDLGSTNGTKLNDHPLIPDQPAQLKKGDSLILANVEFYVAMG